MKIQKLISVALLMSLFVATLVFLNSCIKKDDVNADGGENNGSDLVPKEDRLITNKTTYYNGEEIYITAYGTGDAWVGIYKPLDDIEKVDCIRRYDVNKNGFVSGNTYAFKKVSTVSNSRDRLQYLPNGKYKVILFEDSGKTVVETKNIEIRIEKLAEPKIATKVTYTLDNPTDGIADGKLALEFSSDSYAEEAVMYWANSDGILENYTSLAPFFVTKNNMTFEMYKNTIIPPEATKLWVYSKNSLGISDDYYEVILPQNCQFNFGSASDLISEFQVVSDIHVAVDSTHCQTPDTIAVHEAHLRAMCEDILAVSPNSSGIMVVGDIANSGRRYEWQKAADIFADSKYKGLPNVYYSLGNHDLYGGESYATLIQNFYDFASPSAGVKLDKVYYEKEIGGLHHIFLGSESKHPLDADLSVAQLNWFDKRLEEITAEEPDKPVFVYLHQSLYDTIAGSFPGQGWDGVVQDSEFRAICKKYKQIVMFNGHSHWDMNTRGSMHGMVDGLPNIFNTASVAYLWTSFYKPLGEYLKGSQGYYIKVYQDKIMVLGRDFETNQWIPSANFICSVNN